MINIQHISTVCQKFIEKRLGGKTFKKLTVLIFNLRKNYPKLGGSVKGWLYMFQKTK